MKFNFSKSCDFPPEFKVRDFENNLEVVSETKLLGVIVSNDLKWEANTSYLCKKAYKKLWILRRLKILNTDPLFILDVYTKEIRSILELAVPAWHGGLTNTLSKDLERIQRVAVGIILGQPLPYRVALSYLNLESLSDRRDKLCLKFAKQTLTSKHADIFELNNTLHETRFKRKWKHPICRTKRFFDSPVNFLTRMLNDI